MLKPAISAMEYESPATQGRSVSAALPIPVIQLLQVLTVALGAPGVTGVIAKTQKIPPETVTIDKTFEELKIDSLDGINILFALEGEFDLDIPDDAARGIRTVREMVEGIEKLIVAKEAAAKAAAVEG